MMTQSWRAPAARSIAPPTAGAVSLSDVAVFRHLKRAEHAEIEMAAANERKTVGVVHVGAAGTQRHILLAGIDEPAVDLIRLRRRSHAEHAVLGMKNHLALDGHVIGHFERRADA